MQADGLNMDTEMMIDEQQYGQAVDDQFNVDQNSSSYEARHLMN